MLTDQGRNWGIPQGDLHSIPRYITKYSFTNIRCAYEENFIDGSI